MRVCLAGAGIGLAIATVSLVFGLFLRLAGCPITTGVVVFASFLVFMVAATAPKHALATSVSVVLSLAPTLAFGTAWAVSEPLATTALRCGNAMLGIPFVVVLAVLSGAAIAAPIAYVLRRATRAALPTSAALAVVSLVVITLGFRSFTKPEPDDFARLFTTTTIAPGAHADIGAVAFDYDATPRPAPMLGDRHCVVRANGSDVEFPVVLDCPTLTVRTDAATGLVLFSTAPDVQPVAIATTSGLRPDTITVFDFRGRLGTPRGWVVSALLAFVFAAVAIVVAFVTRKRIAIDGVEAHHEAGWVHGAGAPRFVPELANAAPGPVVVGGATTPPTYRDDGGPEIFTTKLGTLATMLEEQRTRVAAWACVAIASAFLGSIPLWIARLYGLL